MSISRKILAAAGLLVGAPALAMEDPYDLLREAGLVNSDGQINQELVQDAQERFNNTARRTIEGAPVDHLDLPGTAAQFLEDISDAQ